MSTRAERLWDVIVERFGLSGAVPWIEMPVDYRLKWIEAATFEGDNPTPEWLDECFPLDKPKPQA